MFPAKSPFEIPVHNRVDPARGRWLRIAVHEQSESISNILRYHFTWQRQLTQFLAQTLRPGQVFVDVGANLGYFTLIAANAVGRAGRVHSFEPEPRNFALLRKNAALNGFEHVTAHQVAIGDRAGEAVLHLSSANLGAHSLVKQDDLTRELRVPVMTLTAALEQETRPVGMIKIDIQGLDLSVLWGAEELIAGQSPRPRVVMEFNPCEFEKADPGLVRFQDFLRRLGYRVHAFIANERASVIPPVVSVGTLLALHRDFTAEGKGAEFDILLWPE